MQIAVVGSGIAGLGASWALSRQHDVTLYEAADRLGGHANTVKVADRGRRIGVDTGFIVYNQRNYPNLASLFEHLGVATQASEMSFSVSKAGGAFEYGMRPGAWFAQPRNLLSRTHRHLLREVLRFVKEAPAAAARLAGGTTGELLDRMEMSNAFCRDFLLPMVACIWSSSLDAMLEHPATSMIGFLDNHGLLDVGREPRWRTVSGGSRSYVARLAARSSAQVRTGTPVASIHRVADGVEVHDTRGGKAHFDHVVLATHADTSLKILGADAAARERDVLSAFRYQENLAVLHRDPTFMPRRRRVWSSWNYLEEAPDTGGHVSLSYWMNRLQHFRTERPVIVTLNPGREPRDVVRTETYHHPRYDTSALDAQARIPSIQGASRTWFCGSYAGHGFHEDALRAGLDVAAALGAPPPRWATTTPQPRTSMVGA